MAQKSLKLYENPESISAVIQKNKLVLFHLYVILQNIANERDILKGSHKSSDTSMLEFLKSKYIHCSQS